MSLHDNPAQEPEPEFRLLRDDGGDILVRLSLEDLSCILSEVLSPKLKERLEKAKGLLEYSKKREAYVKGK